MKKLILFLFSTFLFSDILSSLKNQTLLNKDLLLEESATIQKQSWINPVVLTYSIKNEKLNIFKKTAVFSISVNQPIFKSGAIYHSIKYANYLEEFNKNNIRLTRNNLIKQAYDLVFDYKIALLNREIVKLNIKNSEIDINRKKEDFKNGTINSNELDKSIINLNNLKLSLNDIENNIIIIENNFKNISDLDIKKVELPKFKLISENSFINNNLELKLKQIDIKVKKELYYMQLGNSLISVNFNALYSHQNSTIHKKNYIDNTYSIGLSFNIPLDINSIHKIKKQKIDYINSNLSLLDKKRELINLYKISLKQIEFLKNKLSIYNDNEKRYKNLIKFTKDSIKSGTMTDLDLEVLENSLRSILFHKKIIQLKINKILLNLYAKSKFIN